VSSHTEHRDPLPTIDELRERWDAEWEIACQPQEIAQGAWRCQLQWERLVPCMGMKAVALDPSLLMTANALRDSPVQPRR
jgi:hypothetical protein